jgi:subtilisin family serine protease
MSEGIKNKIIRTFVLIIFFISFTSFNLLFANSRDLGFEHWCDSLENDEIIIKLKSDSSTLQAQSDFQIAPSYKKQFLANQKNKDIQHLKKYVSDLELENILDLEEETFNPDPKLLERKNKFRKSRARLNLDRIYSIKSKSKNYLANFIPKNQRKIYACQEIYKKIKKLEQDPQVEYVIPNRKLKIQAEIADDYFVNNAPNWPFNYGTQWGLKSINAEKAWSKTLGEKTIVAVIDSGVNYNHPDLWNKIWVNPAVVKDTNRDGKRSLDDLDRNRNKKIDSFEFKANALGFITSTNSGKDPRDFVGHGTHVAGIIGAAADGQGMVGVAPETKIMIIRVISSSGNITEKSIAKGLLIAAKYGADVANLSMGTSYHLPLVYDAIKAVKDQMVIVAAAGNNNQYIASYSRINERSFYPAAYPEVISVAASTETNQKAFFSNYGPAVDVTAPGGSDSRFEKNILSTDITSDGYNRRIGTSMAAPYVTGVVALLISNKPHLSPTQVREKIKNSAKDLDITDDLGSGLVDAENTLL